VHGVQVRKRKMIGQMTIATALLGFNGLERSVTHTFLSRNKFYLQIIISTWSENEQKINVKKLKKFQDFCPRDIESCHLAAARHVKLWLLKANVFFKKPRQLTKFTY